MAQDKDQKIPPSLYDHYPNSGLTHEFTDTDPQMLFVMWDMENGLDPEKSLEEIEDAVVVYDKFRPRLRRSSG